MQKIRNRYNKSFRIINRIRIYQKEKGKMLLKPKAIQLNRNRLMEPAPE